MADLMTLWWVWLSLALILGVVEVLLPGNIFLGFALGALAMVAVVLALPMASVALLAAVFAGLSLAAWVLLHFVFRRQSSGARIVRRDINKD
jgi:inner membrane protein